MSNRKEEHVAKEEKEETLEIVESAENDQIQLEELIEKNPEFLEEIITQHIEIRKSHSGPIPDPETLKEYKQIYKNAPDIIFGMATKEQSFRHFSTYMGQFSALLIGLGGLGVTAYLGVNNQPWLAGVIGFGSLGSLVGVFLHQKKK
jgi:hypothetical protein